MNWLRGIIAMVRQVKTDDRSWREKRSDHVAQKAETAVGDAQNATSEWREQVRQADAALLRRR